MSEQINISGKKIVTYGGSAELPYGTIDTSFKTIYNDLFRFKKVFRDTSAGMADQLFGALDQPGHFYFKLFFYFSNPYMDPSNPMSSNLLGTTYVDEDAKEEMKDQRYDRNTALNYLYNNREYTRFNYLAEFIQLLSDVSTKSPWYFQQISGLDQALERQEIGSRDFKIEEERKSITIKCLPDAYDNRIGRILDLYRAVVWSHNLKKWILPKNLRKFDMGIYIFNSPIKTISGGRYGLSGKISDRVLETTFKEYYGIEKEDVGEYEEQMYKKPVDFAEYGGGIGNKYIELRGCEIDYNSSRGAYADLDNAEGKQMEYEIVVKYDSAVEDRYDPIFREYIGDFVVEDLMRGGDIGELKDANPYSSLDRSDDIVEGSIGDPFGASRTNTLVESALGMGTAYLNTLVNKVLLGNIYGFSFAKLDNILTSDPMSAVLQTGREINNAQLIKKRIDDFIDPNKGTRKLAGKKLYDGWTEYPEENIHGKKFTQWNDIPETGGQSNEIPGKKLPDYPEEPVTELESGDLSKKLPDYPEEPVTELESGDLAKKLPDYPEEPATELESGDLSKKLPDYPEEPVTELESGDLSKKLPDYPEEPVTELDSGDLSKKLPDYPEEPVTELESGDLVRQLPDYPVEPEMPEGDLPKKFTGHED